MNVLIYVKLLLNIALAFKFIPEDESHTYSLLKHGVQKQIASAETIPHHVLIAYGSYYCSGVLVRSQIVVTTASCFVRRRNHKIYVKVGADTVTGQGQVIPVEELKIHEYYKHFSEANNDIALLALKNNVVFSEGVQKVILVDPEVALRVGITIEVSGWGHSNLPPKFTNNLIMSEMVVMHQKDCIAVYNNLITSSSFCAQFQVDRRLSDNGGPAVYRHLLVGLLSFGGTRREEPHVAVFTNISYFHRWITLNSRHFMEKYCKQPDPSKYTDESSDKEE